jgi:uncharacterized membrane protein YeaQ/YmgE (transglycosylase-associated protein family)
MLTFLLWVLFGAFVGWLASLVMARDGQQGTVTNIVVGVLGAALGGFLFSRDVSPNVVSFGSVLTAFVGAVILLALANLFQRGRVR